MPKTLQLKSFTLMTSYWNSFKSIFLSIFNFIQIKLIGAVFIPVYAFLFNIDLTKMMLALFCLITFDLITGIFASWKAGEAIESRKVIKSAFKLAIYGILVSSMHLTDIAIRLTDFAFNLEMGMIGFLAATEGISIIENAGKAGYAVPKKILNTLETITEKVETTKTHTTTKEVSDDPEVDDIKTTTDTETTKSVSDIVKE